MSTGPSMPRLTAELTTPRAWSTRPGMPTATADGAPSTSPTRPDDALDDRRRAARRRRGDGGDGDEVTVEAHGPGGGAADVDADDGRVTAQPLTAPAVRPAVTLRWTIRKKIDDRQRHHRRAGHHAAPVGAPGALVERLQPHRHRLRLRPVHDHEGEDELVPRQDEGEDPRRHEAGRDERQGHPHERAEAAGAVDAGGLLQLQRHAADEPAQRPDRERQDEDQVGQRQPDDRVRQLRPSSTWNSEMISASAGIIWMAMTAMMNAVRPRNRNRDDGDGGEEGDGEGEEHDDHRDHGAVAHRRPEVVALEHRAVVVQRRVRAAGTAASASGRRCCA